MSAQVLSVSLPSEIIYVSGTVNGTAYTWTLIEGAWTATVERAVEYIAGRFAALGYDCPVTVKKDWLTSDAPTASQMEAYRQNIVTLRSQIAVMQSTPEAPASMAGLDYVKANDIEQILLDLDALIDKLIKSWYFSGELYAGEV